MSSDVSKQVRAALKAAGLGPRQVSVRSKSYSMGSTVEVRIKVWSVALGAVEALVRPFEQVRRDEATGEILCGGNTHIAVEYEHDAIAEVRPIIARALESGECRFGSLELLASGSHSGDLEVYDTNAEGRWIARIDRQSAAYLARILASRGELAEVVRARAEAALRLLQA